MNLFPAAPLLKLVLRTAKMHLFVSFFLLLVFPFFLLVVFSIYIFVRFRLLLGRVTRCVPTLLFVFFSFFPVDAVAVFGVYV